MPTSMPSEALFDACANQFPGARYEIMNDMNSHSNNF
jgi:hypothetical protein